MSHARVPHPTSHPPGAARPRPSHHISCFLEDTWKMPQIHKEQSILLGEITGCLICPLPHQGQDQCEAAPGEEPSLGKQSQHKQSHLPWNKLELIFFFFYSAAHLCLKTFPVKIVPWHGQGGELGARQLPGGLAEVVSSRCP